MIRVINVLDRRLVPIPAKPVVLAPGAAADVLPDTTKTSVVDGGPDELAYIELTNIGGNDAYYCYGATCDGVNNVHGILQPKQQLEVPTRSRVSMLSAAGTTIAVMIMQRVNEIPNNYTIS